MIIKKPYQIFIKNFKKIHIFLFVLCAYAYMKSISISSFVKEFMVLGTYDASSEPITMYITPLLYISLILIVITFLGLTILLRYKEKPWKTYLYPLIGYAVYLLIAYATSSYFTSYNGVFDAATIRIYRDMFIMIHLSQLPIFVLLFIRILGVDLNKFDFKHDEDYLELGEEDQEEIEINIDFDKHSVIRLYKRILREASYVYEEHKFIFNTIALILFLIIFGKVSYYYLVENKAYKLESSFKANNYTIKVLNSYYTAKDYKGDVIERHSAFVITNVEITNNRTTRVEPDLSKFHMMSGITNSIETKKMYATQFKDMANPYDTLRLEAKETKKLSLIFKVPANLNPKSFSLYYQNSLKDKLIKVKINNIDVNVVKEHGILKLDESINYKLLNGREDSLTLEKPYLIEDIVKYNAKYCDNGICEIVYRTVHAEEGEKILTMKYGSNYLEGKEIIDFLYDYGKINYIDSNNKSRVIRLENAIGFSYYGKYVYIKVPKDIMDAKTIKLTFTIRDNKYTYKIK